MNESWEHKPTSCRRESLSPLEKVASDLHTLSQLERQRMERGGGGGLPGRARNLDPRNKSGCQLTRQLGFTSITVRKKPSTPKGMLLRH